MYVLIAESRIFGVLPCCVYKLFLSQGLATVYGKVL